MNKRANLKLDRYLNRNRVEPLPARLPLEYSRLPAAPRRAFWRVTLHVAIGAAARVAIGFACLSAMFALGLWQGPAALAGFLLATFWVLSLMVLIAMLRR